MAQTHWREISRNSFTQLGPLLDELQLSEKDRELFDPNPRFPILVPKRLVNKMERSNAKDPLLLQFVPLKEEKVKKQGFCADPVQDQTFTRISGQQESKLLQKYHARVLLLSTSACAMHCRFCFRKNYPYIPGGGFQNEIALIKQDTSVEEVILSGGDPLSLSDEKLQALLEELSSIPHVQRIRFHTRFPIGIPERIDEGFIQCLSSCKKQMFFVLHVNHPNEVDEELFHALKKVSQLGIPVLTHTVLLKGVNDSFVTLKSLFSHLVNHGIVPYYINDLDPVEGSHFMQVERARALSIMEELRANLSGYAVPRFAQEIPGMTSKTQILHPSQGFESE